MQISSKGRYAIAIMVSLAKNYPNDTFLTLKNIADSNHLSIKYLEKIMANLKQADYFYSSRGIDGGYKLKYEPSYYKIGDLVRLAEGDIAITNCVNSSFKCPNQKNCKSYSIWHELNDMINDYLDSKTLEDLL